MPSFLCYDNCISINYICDNDFPLSHEIMVFVWSFI